jgi:RimJ/RimL family protein N-acetyltransferase
MNYNIEKAKPSDAKSILEYLKQVGSETDNLTFGAEGLSLSVEEEAQFIASFENSDRNVMYLAKSGGRIIGLACLTTSPRERLSHRGELAISVLKEAWGRGVGEALMRKIINFAKYTAGADLIHLQVRSDNERAIRLYEKFGFEKIGTFRGYMKIGGELIDCDLMNLYFD